MQQDTGGRSWCFSCKRHFDELIGIGIVNGGTGATPCCRAVTWRGPDGKLAGQMTEMMFCRKCNRLIGWQQLDQDGKGVVNQFYHSECNPGDDVGRLWNKEAFDEWASFQYDVANSIMYIAKKKAQAEGKSARVLVGYVRQAFFEFMAFVRNEKLEGQPARELSLKVARKIFGVGPDGSIRTGAK